ncbi:large-conductance mechanosensitive channel [Psittacicella melopsittaci]|uniref:Large-conductance mechanosensitive channel n=1 Tax=Psittacicella melopsittaci TaxID=2028576 RepID=A0A3A1Y328_9GAMM|nr:large-conductance mechanosensitive channel protein MscL [Psittacicella melopsittaci]RIY31699.1 large-conductance mechanosensitive channel [Psittacicella melopsittaci]
MSLFQEFKKFALKGNVVDLAVGVVIGGAFGKVVSSLVSDIIMPLVGLLTGGISFKDMKWQITDGVAITYGNFIDAIVNLVIIAAAIFFVIKAMIKIRTMAENALSKQKEEEQAAEEKVEEVKLTADQQLLTEIRDLLKANAEKTK